MTEGLVTRSAVILAGGLGTRLRSAVPDLPKPMAPVNGVPFLQHQLDFWIRSGIRKFVLSVGYRHQEITGHFGPAYGGADLIYAFEEKPLGTGGGLLLSAGLLPRDEPFLLLNGDTYFDVSLAEFSAFHRQKDAEISVALMAASEPERFGLAVCGPDGRIQSLAEKPADLGQPANGGVYCIAPAALRAWRGRDKQKLSFEQEMLPALIQAGARIFGMPARGRFLDIGVPADYAKAGDIIGRERDRG